MKVKSIPLLWNKNFCQKSLVNEFQSKRIVDQCLNIYFTFWVFFNQLPLTKSYVHSNFN